MQDEKGQTRKKTTVWVVTSQYMGSFYITIGKLERSSGMRTRKDGLTTPGLPWSPKAARTASTGFCLPQPLLHRSLSIVALFLDKLANILVPIAKTVTKLFLICCCNCVMCADFLSVLRPASNVMMSSKWYPLMYTYLGICSIYSHRSV